MRWVSLSLSALMMPVELAALRFVLDRAGLERLAEHADERQRRLELVRDVRDEIRLQPGERHLVRGGAHREANSKKHDEQGSAEKGQRGGLLPPHELADRSAVGVKQGDLPGGQYLGEVPRCQECRRRGGRLREPDRASLVEDPDADVPSQVDALRAPVAAETL